MKDASYQEIVPVADRLSVYKNRHRTIGGRDWGWVTGCTKNIVWEEGRKFDQEAARAFVDEYNNRDQQGKNAISQEAMYAALIEDMRRLHVNKNAGYAGDSADSWANFRMSEAFGVSAFLGTLVRMSDKKIRIDNLVANPKNEKVGESILDTLMDLASYSLIALCIWRERGLTRRIKRFFSKRTAESGDPEYLDLLDGLGDLALHQSTWAEALDSVDEYFDDLTETVSALKNTKKDDEAISSLLIGLAYWALLAICAYKSDVGKVENGSS